MMTAQISQFTGGFTATNGWLMHAPEGHLLIDAPTGVTAWLAAQGIQPSALLLTHDHFDHVMEAAACAAMGMPIYAYGPTSPETRLEAVVQQWTGQALHIPAFTVTHHLQDVSDLNILGLSLNVRHVPGHSPDSLVYIHHPSGVVFSGDTIMDGGLGRADLPGGDFSALSHHCRTKLLTLPADFRIHPGHGGISTIEWELRNNMLGTL